MNLKAPEKVKRVNEKNGADFESREMRKRVKSNQVLKSDYGRFWPESKIDSFKSPTRQYGVNAV